jgi:hypothetical protein
MHLAQFKNPLPVDEIPEHNAHIPRIADKVGFVWGKVLSRWTTQDINTPPNGDTAVFQIGVVDLSFDGVEYSGIPEYCLNIIEIEDPVQPAQE